MQNKQYIVFINDHSGSMNDLRQAAIKDYNRNIQAVVNAANQEKLDTIVSVIDFGFDINPVKRTIVNSNPHVLNPISKWYVDCQTPLYDAIADAIKLCKSLPDYTGDHVSFLLMITTDGQENSSHLRARGIKSYIESLDSRWTIVCRVPPKSPDLSQIGIPKGNIQVWDTTNKGMEKSTKQNEQALNTYFKARSTGKTNSSSFYSNVEVETKLADKQAKETKALKANQARIIREKLANKKEASLDALSIEDLEKQLAELED